MNPLKMWNQTEFVMMIVMFCRANGKIFNQFACLKVCACIIKKYVTLEILRDVLGSCSTFLYCEFFHTGDGLAFPMAKPAASPGLPTTELFASLKEFVSTN